MSQHLIFPQFVFFAGLAFDTVLIIMLVDGTFKAGVVKASKAALHKVRKITSKRVMPNWMLRMQSKYISSWPVFKVYIGSVNFYEEKSALVFLDFNITQVVNLLL